MGIFKKKTKSKAVIPLTEQVQMAEQLRQAAVKTDRAHEKVINSWINSDSKNEKMWAAKSSMAEKRADKAYRNYYEYCHSTFSEEDIKNSGAQGKFLSKSFINRLNKIQLSKNKKK